MRRASVFLLALCLVLSGCRLLNHTRPDRPAAPSNDAYEPDESPADATGVFADGTEHGRILDTGDYGVSVTETLAP